MDRAALVSYFMTNIKLALMAKAQYSFGNYVTYGLILLLYKGT